MIVINNMSLKYDDIHTHFSSSTFSSLSLINDEDKTKKMKKRTNGTDQVEKKKCVSAFYVGGHDKTKTTESKMMKFNPTFYDH